MNEFIDFVSNNWEKLLGFLIALGSIWKYFDTRRRELAWKRTEMILHQGVLFDRDPGISEATMIIEGRKKGLSVESLFDSEGSAKNIEMGEIWHKIDKMLNLLDRIAYATLELKTISEKEASNFGWYYKILLKNKLMNKYCSENGFQDILKLAKKI